MAHLYAMFLLAQFRETRAYPLVVRFALLPEDIEYSLCGDFITESLGQVIASVWGGDLDIIWLRLGREDVAFILAGAG